MRAVMESEYQFPSSELDKVERGEAVARMAPTHSPDDVRMAGVIRIQVSSDEFMRAYRHIETFEVSKEVLHAGRFSSPPSEADIEGFNSTDFTKRELQACRPGHCSYKLPAWLMEDLQAKINWDAPDAEARAKALIKQHWIAYVKRYQQQGDSALAVYYDTPAPYSLAEGLRAVLSASRGLWSQLPDLATYVESYPRHKPAGVDDFFYWQEAAFGLKRVLRTQHVIIQKLPNAGDPHYAIVSKMLFATHYFRAAFEFKYIYPVRTASGQQAIYLMACQRSFVDGMTGIRGAILRKIAESRSPASMKENLELGRTQLERAHRAQ
ncbi:MAG TPA: hypothetical protein VGK29_14360 [Paludibaculum sp.]